MNGSLSEKEEIFTKNRKMISNNNGPSNGQIPYQNGNTKSDVAVIDIIEDGKFYALYFVYFCQSS